MTMQLYFVRHGESEANLLHQFSNRPGRHGLTERGRKQAAELAGMLAGIPFKCIYTSPLLRAIQTAEILSANLKAPVIVTDALREYDVGKFEGSDDPADWQEYDEVLDAWLLRGEWDRRTGGGESFHEIRTRFEPLIRQLCASAQSGDHYALVGHGGTYRCMLPLVLSNLSFEWIRHQPIHHTTPILAELLPAGLQARRWGGITFEEQRSI